LSAGLREKFAALYEAVKDKVFDSENLLSLKEFASFPTANHRQVVTELLMIGAETAATGDEHARVALLGVVMALADKGSYKLVRKPPAREV